MAKLTFSSLKPFVHFPRHKIQAVKKQHLETKKRNVFIKFSEKALALEENSSWPIEKLSCHLFVVAGFAVVGTSSFLV